MPLYRPELAWFAAFGGDPYPADRRCGHRGDRGGAEQLAILGAGYDTRGLRLPAAREIPVFELDQPPTQERKKQRLRARDGDLPSNVTYVPFDLLDEGVGAPLERAGFRTGLKSVYIWEGY